MITDRYRLKINPFYRDNEILYPFSSYRDQSLAVSGEGETEFNTDIEIKYNTIEVDK